MPLSRCVANDHYKYNAKNRKFKRNTEKYVVQNGRRTPAYLLVVVLDAVASTPKNYAVTILLTSGRDNKPIPRCLNNTITLPPAFQLPILLPVPRRHRKPKPESLNIRLESREWKYGRSMDPCPLLLSLGWESDTPRFQMVPPFLILS